MVNISAASRREEEVVGPTKTPSSRSSSSSSMSRRSLLLPPVATLFVWDFDWTIVNCNSDEYVPSHFMGTEMTESTLRAMMKVRGHTKWHECVSDLVNLCISEYGATMDDVHDAASDMPYLADVRGAMEDVHDDDTCGQAIISDGNDVFIGAFLSKNGMDSYFAHGVMTNMGRWDHDDRCDDASDDDRAIIGGERGGGGGGGGGRGGERGDATYDTRTGRRVFRVMHQSSVYGGHTNGHCPPNLCKTQVLLDILDRTATTTVGGGRPRIVYVGDGSNDACPALHVLNERDVLLARNGRRISDPNAKRGIQHDEEDGNDAL